MTKIFTLISVVFIFNIFVFSQEKTKLEKGLYAHIITDKGEIHLQLFDKEAPLTVANFVGLAEGKLNVFDTIKINKPYYDGVKFHRVIANFMIQGGDPTGTGSGGPGYKFFDETDNGIPHDAPGILSMANAGPNTNGSQFFITHLPTPHLNGKHTVFGKVIEGQDVVDNIRQNDEIKKIKIKKKGLKYKFFYKPSKIFTAQYEALAVLENEKREKMAKLEAQNKVRMIEAQGRTVEEYKPYFLNMIQEMYPEAKQTESGLVYVVEKEGEGDKPKKGDKLSLHYKGTLVYGDKFDSSYDRNMPMEFEYLNTSLIPGFNEGIALTKNKGKIKVFIPYYLGYGKQGRRPTIPPFADLIFDIEILSID